MYRYGCTSFSALAKGLRVFIGFVVAMTFGSSLVLAQTQEDIDFFNSRGGGFEIEEKKKPVRKPKQKAPVTQAPAQQVPQAPAQQVESATTSEATGDDAPFIPDPTPPATVAQPAGRSPYTFKEALDIAYRNYLLNTQFWGSYTQKINQAVQNPNAARAEFEAELQRVRADLEFKFASQNNAPAVDQKVTLKKLLGDLLDYQRFVVLGSALVLFDPNVKSLPEWARSFAVQVPFALLDTYLTKFPLHGKDAFTTEDPENPSDQRQQLILADKSSDLESLSRKGSILSSVSSNGATEILYFEKTSSTHVTIGSSERVLKKLQALNMPTISPKDKLLQLFKSDLLKKLKSEKLSNQIYIAMATNKAPATTLKQEVKSFSTSQVINASDVYDAVQEHLNTTCSLAIAYKLQKELSGLKKSSLESIKTRFALDEMSTALGIPVANLTKFLESSYDLVGEQALSAVAVAGHFDRAKLKPSDVDLKSLSVALSPKFGTDTRSMVMDIFKANLATQLSVKSGLKPESPEFENLWGITESHALKVSNSMRVLKITDYFVPKKLGDWGCSLGEDGFLKFKKIVATEAKTIHKLYSSIEEPKDEVLDLRTLVAAVPEIFSEQASKDMVIEVALNFGQNTAKLTPEEVYKGARVQFRSAQAKLEEKFLSAKEGGQTSLIYVAMWERAIQDLNRFGRIVRFDDVKFADAAPKLTDLEGLDSLAIVGGQAKVYEKYILNRISRLGLDTKYFIPMGGSFLGMKIDSLKFGVPRMMFHDIVDSPGDELNIFAEGLSKQTAHFDELISLLSSSTNLDDFMDFVVSSRVVKELLNDYNAASSPTLQALRGAYNEWEKAAKIQGGSYGYASQAVQNMTGIQDQVLIGGYMSTMVIDLLLPGTYPIFQRLKSFSYAFNRGLDPYFVLTFALMAIEPARTIYQRATRGRDHLVDFSIGTSAATNKQSEAMILEQLEDGVLVNEMSGEVNSSFMMVGFLAGAMLAPAIYKAVAPRVRFDPTVAYNKSLKTLKEEGVITDITMPANYHDIDNIRTFAQANMTPQVASALKTMERALAVERAHITQLARYFKKELAVLGVKKLDHHALDLEKLEKRLMNKVKTGKTVTPEEIIAFTRIERYLQERIIRSIDGEMFYAYGDSFINRKPFGTRSRTNEFHFNLKSITPTQTPQMRLRHDTYAMYVKYQPHQDPAKIHELSEAYKALGVKPGVLTLKQLDKAHEAKIREITLLNLRSGDNNDALKQKILALNDHYKRIASYLNRAHL